jgi:hypothetical protein
MASRIQPVRRIVTGHDAKGRSTILMDEASPHAVTLPGVDNFGCTDLWKTYATPADNAGTADACHGPLALAPPQRGSVFRVVEFPPDKEYIGKWKREDAFAAMGESGAAAVTASAERHEGMHRTHSIDYAIVLSGEIWAVLDTAETLMRAGDVLVQRGTNHAWSNRSEKPCLVAFVLIDALPAVVS